MSTIFSGAIFDIQVWNEEGAGLRRVRFLKNDISFFILVISVSFWTPQAWNEEGAGLRRVRFLKNDMSWNEKSKLLRDARNADNSRNPPAPRPNPHLGRDKPVVETPHWDSVTILGPSSRGLALRGLRRVRISKNDVSCRF